MGTCSLVVAIDELGAIITAAQARSRAIALTSEDSKRCLVDCFAEKRAQKDLGARCA